MPDNFERMIKLAEEFFGARSDPNQISVDEKILEKLARVDPATRMQEVNEDGPITWILVIPTTNVVMNRFLREEISENELLELTLPGEKYDSVYLCSALVLPENRGKGIAKQLTIEAIRSISKRHPIRSLYVWAFSDDGARLAAAVAKEVGLPLYKRKESQHHLR
jgi:ribosomal protein S18 acetylase RimI-like enzyme